MILLNPKRYHPVCPDPESNEMMKKTIEFFENKGKRKLKEDDHNRTWYSDFLDFQKNEKLFTRLLTPAHTGEPNSRWDTWRICQLNEILGFYGLPYWYTWQVTILGLGPIWMSKNESAKKRTVQLLQKGGIFGFGLSEKEHGADLYSSEMLLKPSEQGSYLAQGRKYYIGNANQAAFVSTFGKDSKTNEYTFFLVETQNSKFECIQNVVNSQNYVAEYALHDYPISEDDILSRGSEAWDSALNTVNIGKYNLGWASIGICTHAFYESINHASKRKLYQKLVTDFPHIQQLFVDAYTRLVAMKLFALRANDYMRCASSSDRRYLLYNPMVKMKVTTQGEEVVNLLWDIIAAKGFEKNMYFESATRDIRALPKLEGTVHVNMALIIKFMKNYFFKPMNFSDIPKRDDSRDDSFLFEQGPTKGLGKIQFHDYRIAYNSVQVPNIKIFKNQIKLFKRLLWLARPTEEQSKDIDFLLVLGELFTLVAYGQLIIENFKIYQIDSDLLDQIFDFMIRDFSKYALQLYSKTSSTRIQMILSQLMIQKPIVNQRRFEKIWKNHVYSLRDTYEMKNA